MGHPFGERDGGPPPTTELTGPVADIWAAETEPAPREGRLRTAAANLAEWRRTVRLTPLGVFAVAFMLLSAAAVAAGLAHFTASGSAPWVSVGFSGGAVLFTVAALRSSGRR